MIQSIVNLPIISESVTIEVMPLSRYANPDGTTNNDLAAITAVIRLAQPLAQETKFLLPVVGDAKKSPKMYLPNGDKLEVSFEPTAEDDVNSLQGIMQSTLSSFIGEPSEENMVQHVKHLAEYKGFKENSQVVTIPAGQTLITFTYKKDIPMGPDGVHTLETIVPFTSFQLNPQPGAKADVFINMPFEIGTDVNKILEARWTQPGGTPQELTREPKGGRMLLWAYWQYDPAVVVRYMY